MRVRSEKTRDDIIAAARTLFLRRGYVAATVDAIAAEAQVTKRTVYGYYPDKQALFRGVIEAAVRASVVFPETAPEVSSLPEVRKALTTIGKGINDTIEQPDYIKLLRTIVAEIPHHPELSGLFERGITPQALRAATTIFRQADALHLLKVPDPDIAARQFVGGFVIRILLDGLLQPSGAPIPAMSLAELTRHVDSFLPSSPSASERGSP